MLMFSSSDLVSTGELADPWVYVDLERYYSVSSIWIFNREMTYLVNVKLQSVCFIFEVFC